jgi:cellulose synthase/poly-beta-1,6-N-acetylglucosamine synthase-like glycosyltransferase
MTLEILFWSSLGALVWAHVGYPLVAAALASIRERRVRKADITPTVAVVVAAHDEEAVIAGRLENLLELDYPRERLEVIVASDGSRDRTNEIVEEFARRESRVRLVACPRRGKVAAQDAAVATVRREIVAFSDANTLWAPAALRALVRNFADPEVAYVCGNVRLEEATGTNREGVYWRYELWLRASESRLGSITGGNGAIYAVRRTDYVDGDSRFGHDFGLPYVMVQRGRRAVYEPDAIAVEKVSRNLEDEYGRKVRMFSRSWLHVLSGRMFRRSPPLYLLQLISHRLLRYGSGVLHVILFATTVALARRSLVYDVILAAQVAALVLAAAGRLRLPFPGAALAYYYFLVMLATVVGLVRYVRFGVPVVWDKAEGTR